MKIWSLLNKTTSLQDIFQALDIEIGDLPVEQQLAIVSEVFLHLADAIEQDASSFFQGWESQGREPVLSSDFFTGLVRRYVQMEVESLKEPLPPSTQRQRRRKYKPKDSDSIAGSVPKDKVLEMVDLQKLAGQEDVQNWVTQIQDYLQQYPSPVRLSQLVSELQMPLVEVWMGLLLGEFYLIQDGDFYDRSSVLVMPQKS